MSEVSSKRKLNNRKFLITFSSILFFAFSSGLRADDAASPPSTIGDVNNAAFEQMLQSYFPLTPSQIHEFKDAVAAQQEANSTPHGSAPPQGTSRIIPVTLKPGGEMQVVNISSGMLTSIIFTDAAGQPWPITSYSIGDPDSFAISWDKVSATLMIQGQKLYGQTNIGVMLKGMQMPIMLELILGQSKWDYQDYIQLDQNQPGDSASSLPVPQAPDYLVNLLSGVPPQGALSLNVSDSTDAQAWSYQGNYLLLTQATLLSPAFTSRADGPGSTPMHAYVLQPTPEVLLSNPGNILGANTGNTGNMIRLLISTGDINANS